MCYTTTYAVGLTTSIVSTILSSCTGNKLLLGCRPAGATIFTVAAMGNRADVLYSCASSTTCTHDANGVSWYFSDSYSWGFAPGGSTVNRVSCDDVTTNGGSRLCWHTSGSTGYRCGSTIAYPDANWEKVVYHAN